MFKDAVGAIERFPPLKCKAIRTGHNEENLASLLIVNGTGRGFLTMLLYNHAF